MRVLLDHCLDWRLRRSLPNHEVQSADDVGWEELKNGKLLATAATAFDVIITVDQKIKSEQNLANLPISVVVLIAKSNRLTDLLPLIPATESVLQNLRRGQLIEIRLTGITIVASSSTP